MFKKCISMMLSVCILFSSLPVQALAATVTTAKPDRERSSIDFSGLMQWLHNPELSDPAETALLPESPVEDFLWKTVATEDGRICCTITGYTGTDAHVVIPKMIEEVPVEEIGNKAFSGNETLTGIVLPATLRSIGSYAFQNCTALTELTLPNGLETIESYAFQYSGITRLELPDSVTSVSLDGIKDQLTYLRWTAGIPEIGKTEFMYMPALETIVIPEGVTSMEEGYYSYGGYCGAFGGDTALKNVSLPSTLTNIGGYAFYGCTALESITIPENVTAIGSYAFSGCESLSDLSLPESLRTIGSYAFDNCTALTELTLPNGLETIESYAFQYSGITRLELPDSVTSVSLDGIKDQLTYLRWTAGIPEIGKTEFKYMPALETIVIPEGVTSMEEGFYTYGEYYGAFAGDTALKNVALPSTLTNIGGYAFYGCTALESITIPENVTAIGSYAFSGCESLSDLSLPESLRTIGSYAFDNCTALTELTLPNGLETIESYAFQYCGITRLELPDSLTSVSLDGIKDQLTYLRWTAGIPEIGKTEFKYMPALETIVIPEGVTSMAEGSYNYGEYYGAFAGDTALKNVSLPSTLTNIGGYAFYGCTALESLTIPAGVKQFGSYAFGNCTALLELQIQYGLETIGSYAFYNCAALKNLTLPDSVTELGECCFYDCKELEQITLSAGLKRIGSSAFYNCEKITEIELPDGLEVIERSAFSGTSITELILPDSVTEVSLEGLSSQLTYVRWTAGIPVISSRCFMEFGNLKTVTIPEGVTEIADGGTDIVIGILQNFAYPYSPFWKCYALESIILPESLTRVGVEAFRDCTNLTYVQLGKNVEYIGGGAFSGCSKLTLGVWPGSWAEQYAVEQGYDYVYLGRDATLDITLTSAVFEGMLLTLECENVTLTRRIDGESVYRFSGLQEDSEASVRITNAYGEVVLRQDQIFLQPGAALELSPDSTLCTLAVTVLNASGADVTGQVSVDWFVDGETRYASGTNLKGLPMGKELLCRIQLGGTLSREYIAPADQICVADGKRLTVTLERIPVTAITGTVTDGKKPIADAAVVLAQIWNGKSVGYLTVRTDAQGAFTAEAVGSDTEITVSAYGYCDESRMVECSGGNLELGEIVLSPVTGLRLTVEATFTENSADAAAVQSQTLNSLDNLNITVFNRTRNAYVTGVIRQGMDLILTHGVEPGDRLEVTISSPEDDFMPLTVELTSGVDQTLNAALTQCGQIIAAFRSSGNNRLCMLVFDGEGKQVWSGSADRDAGSIASAPVPDGTYRVMLIGESEFLTYPNTLDGFRVAGYQEYTDYCVQQVEVTSGSVAECSFDSVPRLNEQRFYYTDPDSTSVTASKNAISAGQYLTLRAEAAFRSSYQGSVSGVTWIVELSEELEYFEGTLSVAGVENVEYEFSDGVLRIPVEDPSATLRLCVNGVGQGSGYAAVSLQFDYNGTLIRQSVGRVTVDVNQLDFSVTEKTFTPNVTVDGTAAGGAEIQVYDNDVLVGRTQASPSGYWKLSFDLIRHGTCSEHRIYVQTTLSNGTQIRSMTRNVVYQYAPENISARKVSMYLGNSTQPAAVFDFRNPQVRGMSYAVEGAANFTFVAEFDCPDLSRLSDVQLEVDLTDGSVAVLDMIYDENRQAFVTSQIFSISAMPMSIAISYLYDQELVFSEEHMSGVAEKLTILDQLTDELGGQSLFCDPAQDQTLLEWKTEFGSEVPVPDSLIQTVAEYNQALDVYIKAWNEYDDLTRGLFGTMEWTESSVCCVSDAFQASCETGYLENLILSDLIDQGYSVHQIGDSDQALILMRTVVDPETGSISQSVIDTSTAAKELYSVPSSEMQARFFLLNKVLSALHRAGRVTSQNIGAELQNDQTYPLKGYISYTEVIPGSGSGLNPNAASDWLNAAEYMMQTRDLVNEADIANLKELGKYKDEVWKNFEDKFHQYETEADPVKAKELEKICEKENKIFDDLTQKLKMGEKVTGAVQGALKVASPIVDAVNIGQDLNRIMDLNRLIDQTDSMDAKILRAQLGCRVILSTLSVVAAFTTGGIALAAVGLVASVAVGCLDLDGKTERIKQKYYGNGATGTAIFRPIIDPSGYIYEAVASNRLSGVTVTCYEQVTEYDMYDEPYTRVQMWDAVEFDQQNPLITDAEGRYSWDVPQGWWQVKAELPGYETTYSAWLPVPPPQLEVNLGMVSYQAPEIESVDAQPGQIQIVFTKYMRTDMLTVASVQLSADGEKIKGRLELMDQEENPKNREESFARTIRFIPDNRLEDGTEITVTVSDRLSSYAGVPITGTLTHEVTVRAQPETMTVTTALEIPYPGNGKVTVQVSPYALAAGKTVTVTVGSEVIAVADKTSIVMDEFGYGEVQIQGLLPGTTWLKFAIEGTDLEAQTQITVKMPEGCDLKHDYEKKVTYPTCTEAGFTTYTCSRCGDRYVSDETAPLGHSYGQWYTVTEPTEDREGMEQRDCTRCNDAETRPLERLEHTHLYEESITAPTCTETGYTTYTCLCGDSYISDETEALGHEWAGVNCIHCDAVRRNPFTDVPDWEWYFEPVLWAVEQGITAGTSDTTFSPGVTCTRAQVVTFLWRSFGTPTPESGENPFSDVPEGAYYYDAVLWAVEQGITAGTSATTFSPNNPCTRDQVVTFLWRAMGKPEPAQNENPFTDVPDNAYYYVPVLWAVEQKITSGTSATSFTPSGPCTRGQVVTFLYRAMK